MSYNKIVEGQPGDVKFLLGNEAVARGALESGIDVYTYYPGTPSSEVGEIFTDIYKRIGMKWVESSINEKVAIEVAGAAYARGASVMVGMKNVGLNLASDPLFALVTTRPKNKNSALVILVADDPQQHSSAVEMDTRNYLKIFKIPALEPSNPQECLKFTKRAFQISRELKLPVILRTVTMVSHSRSNVTIGEIKQSEMDDNFDLSKEVNVASRIYFLKLKEDQIYNRMRLALELSEHSSLNQIKNENEKNEQELGIITSGVSYSYVIEALEFLNLKAPVLKIGFINPLPEKLISSFLRKFKHVIVVEEMDAYMETQIMAIAQKNGLNLKIHGKNPFAFNKDQTLLSMVGELNPTKIALTIQSITKIKLKIDLEHIYSKNYETVKRKSIMCPGCPHRTTGYAIQRAVRKIKSKTGNNVYFYQDIGCYTLLSYPPLSFANVKYCMGSSIALAQGVAHTNGGLNIAIIGDGTFFHSGIPALLNGIYNRAPILVLILDNGWIGMTGQQPNPGSDVNYYKEGQFKNRIELEKFLKGTGVNVSVIKRNENKDKQYVSRLQKLIDVKGCEVLEDKTLQIILVQDECIQKIIKRKKSTPEKVDLDLCNNCGICYNQFLCPVISEHDSMAYIDPNDCVGCGICEEICPNEAIKEEEKN